MFLITKWDNIDNEHPSSYAEIVPPAPNHVDHTGCEGHPIAPVLVKSLGEFVGTAAIEEYLLNTCTENALQMTMLKRTLSGSGRDSVILISGHDPTFTSPENLPPHSLYEFLGIKTLFYNLKLVSH
ncbi:hypothetical protein EDC04DRAFT_2907452 [Pisolithus marmoratus]|nr:hypothetical protein EDC04DRAFT_2907452 [Pisolithus marmoratus]